MNLLVRLLHSLAMSLGCGAFFLSAKAAEWPFQVTPDGVPAFTIRLGSATPQKFMPPLTLRHQLKFDGRSFFSHVGIPELETYLIREKNDTFEWKPLGDVPGAVRLGRSFRMGKQTWVAARTGEDQIVIRTLAGTASFTYLGTALVAARIDGDDYRLVRADGALIRIEQVAPAAATIATFVYDERGLLAELRSDGRSLHFSYNQDLQLVSCWSESVSAPVIECEYEDRLLTRARLRKAQYDYEWATLEMDHYLAGTSIPRPYVKRDNLFIYRTSFDGRISHVRFQEIAGPRQGRWRFEPGTGRLQWGFGS